jgi:hypothetical protein
VGIEKAFDDYQRKIDADIAHVRLARSRRDAFKAALIGDADVARVFSSGSIARSTQLDPIHDLDLIVEFDHAAHPMWGEPGPSAHEALAHIHERVVALLGVGGGTSARLVRQATAAGRNRSVKCFIDDPQDDDGFTVDAMPVIRQADGTLLIPCADDSCWTVADPESLIEAVAKAQEEWAHFRQMVRVLKHWRLSSGTPVKSLVIEVLALSCGTPGGTRAEWLLSFFTSAATEIWSGVEDPAGHCGPIQPDLDVAALATALGSARDRARLAVTAEADGDTDTALTNWQKVFGSDFPGARKRATVPGLVPAVVPAIRPRPVKDAPQG